MQQTKTLRYTVAALTAATIGTFNLFGAAVPTGDGAQFSLINAPGALVAVTSTPNFCINWGGAGTCVAGTMHNVSVASFSADYLSGTLPANQIQDILSFPGPILTNFLSLTGGAGVAGATVHFDLTSVPLTNGGAGFSGPFSCSSPSANTPNNSCSPPNSAFSFAMDSSGTQVSISFSVTLNAYTGTSATGVTPYRGFFTTQQSGVLDGMGACAGLTASITNILNCQAAGGTIRASWSAAASPVTRFDGCTVTQGGWHAPSQSAPGRYLDTFFPTKYPAGVSIGTPMLNLLFDNTNAIRSFLPQGGQASFLNASAVDPTGKTSAGVFGGQVLALQLNVDLHGLGGLTLSGTGTPFDGKTVSQVLNAANFALGTPGGLPAGFASYSTLSDLVESLNSSFDNCVPDAWAMSHLH